MVRQVYNVQFGQAGYLPDLWIGRWMDCVGLLDVIVNVDREHGFAKELLSCVGVYTKDGISIAMEADSLAGPSQLSSCRQSISIIRMFKSKERQVSIYNNWLCFPTLECRFLRFRLQLIPTLH